MIAGIRAFRDFIRDPTGSMTVEFVVLVPLLLAALVFSFDFARALWAYDVMTRDFRGGVRYFSRSASNFAPPDCPVAAQALVTNGPDAAAHFPWKGATAPWPKFTCDKTNFAAGFNQAVNVVTMKAEVPVTLSFLTFLNTVTGGALSTGAYTLSVSDQARLIGN